MVNSSLDENGTPASLMPVLPVLAVNGRASPYLRSVELLFPATFGNGDNMCSLLSSHENKHRRILSTSAHFSVKDCHSAHSACTAICYLGAIQEIISLLSGQRSPQWSVERVGSFYFAPFTWHSSMPPLLCNFNFICSRIHLSTRLRKEHKLILSHGATERP